MNLERILKGTIFSIGIVAVGAAVASSALVINLPMVPPAYEAPVAPPDSGKKDTLKYPFKDRVSDVYSLPYDNSPLYLGDPSNITTTIDYDPATNEYNINERVGNQFYRNPNYMTFQEYVDDQNKKSTQAYWKQLAEGANIVSQKKGFNPKLYVPGKLFETIFGGNSIDIRPQGSVELRFGLQSNRNDNPALPEKQRKVTTFDFNQKIQLNVVGNIGTKLKTAINYNTEASFEFENRMKLEFTGGEDDILKKLEAGNVTLPLNGTLIQGSQSLFGIKAQLQFGHLTVTSIFSQQKGKTSTIEVKGGAQTQQYELTCDNYEANRHFFLAQYFRDNYDAAMRNIPVIQSPVTITKIEVWIVKPGQIDTRALIGLADAGESNPSNTNFLTPGVSPLPGNDANSLYSTLNAPPYNQLRNVGFANFNILNQLNMVAPKDYERIDNAVKLNPNEYTFNPRLGFISLRSSLNPNQVLAVAYEYQVNGKLYRVGDLTNSGVNPQDRMYVKMLKSSNLNVTLPIWDLMMKNVYNIGAYGVQPKDFKLNILFFDDSTGTNINFLPVSSTQPKLFGKPLLRVLNLDRLNSQNDPQPDGVFDYVEGLTINSSDGRVYIPVVEPFGKSLQALFTDSASASKYMYQELYDQTKVAAQQITEKNKYRLKGTYSSSVSSDIALNQINIAQGSVKVSSGGIPLTENVDFTVDYNLGRVKIINEAYLNSATPLQIRVESNSLFALQTRRLMGTHLDYQFNKDFQIGATIMNLSERPITQKVNFGDEPISNTIWGLDGNYRTDSRFITKLIDKLPFISTKDISTVTISGEFAHFIPGHPKVIGKGGVSYIDDFEGSQSSLDIRNAGNWYLASTPDKQPNLFPESLVLTDSLASGKNRAKLAWYTIDRSVFYNGNSLKPAAVTDVELSKHDQREVLEQELFDRNNGTQTIPPLQVLNLAYYPTERGPYNLDVGPTQFSKGVAADGSLNDPASRWGGIMRRLETNDFEAANVEYITFWLMDPFNEDNPNQADEGKLYFNLGQISEDILHDGFKLYENGLKCPNNTLPIDTCAWGIYPFNPTNPTNAFDNDPDCRALQDVGYDGLPTSQEKSFFTGYLSALGALHGTASQAYIKAEADPSSDNFQYFRGSNEPLLSNPSITSRYKNFNSPDGNSPTPQQSPEAYSTQATNFPESEDINRDGNMDTYENYFQYEIKVSKADLKVGSNYITDKREVQVTTQDKRKRTIAWYQYRIPVNDELRQKIGDIQDLRSIGFIRMFMKGFSAPIVMRFGRLELTRGEWRKYTNKLISPGIYIDPPIAGNTSFEISAVNIEENKGKVPCNYVIPPGIIQEVNVGSAQLQRLNEQSMVLRVCGLQDGDARAAFKTLELDLRNYKHVKMFVHCEDNLACTDDFDCGPGPVQDNDLVLFVRLGTDNSQNYYEYEMPLKVTNYSGTAIKDADNIWKSANELDIDLEKLLNAKLSRGNTGGALQAYVPYGQDGDRNIYVVGSPNLSNVRTIMIGIRNPKQGGIVNFGKDDGQAKCAEVWVNELRLTDFDERGGYAANARIATKLANLGNLTLSGSRKTIGFGGIEQKVNERQREDFVQYDIATTLELGKFFPDKISLSIPFYYSFGQIIAKPQFNPLDPDVPFQTALKNLEADKAAELRRNTIDMTKSKSISFTNVRKNKTGGKSHIYDIENFNVSYSYTELYHRNINLQYDLLRNHRASLGYNYNATVKPWEPFKKSKFVGNSKWIKLVKDVNVNPVPNSLSFRTDLDRQYGEQLLRNNTTYKAIIDTTFNKYFNWIRAYDLRWDITKSIKFDFSANNQARVDEPAGRIDTQEEKDSIKYNVRQLGRNTQYGHNGNVNYQIPLNKIPLLDWISVNTKYGFDYGWQAAPLRFDSVLNKTAPNAALGNTIQNSNTKSVNATLTFTQLYNKVPFFKKLLAPKPPKPVTPKVKPEPKKDPNDTTKVKTPPPPKPPRGIPDVVRFIGKAIFCVKSAGGTFSETNGTMFPGYRRRTEMLGQEYYTNEKGESVTAPGWGFVFGSQKDIRFDAAQNLWLSSDTSFNSQYTRNFTQNITARSTIEPITGFRIELNATRNYARNLSENYRATPSGVYRSVGALETGNFSISYITWNTSFIKPNKDNTSDVFKTFDANRQIISRRIGVLNPYSSWAVDDSGYVDGYSGTQQDVLTLSFLAAYSGRNPETIKNEQFLKIPLPNWRITYDGLSKMAWSKKLFTSVNITHGYRSTYNINTFNTNLNYADPQNYGTSGVRDASGNFIPKYEATQVSITESFSPLIGVDMTWKKNGLFTRMELKRDRNLSLTYTGIQLTEIRSNELTVGAGYRIPKFKLPFKIRGKQVKLQNDLNITADFGMRKNITVIRKMQEKTDIPTSGMNSYTIKVAADYVINDRFNVRFYFDKVINEPVIATSFPNSNTQVGFAIRFTLAQ